MARKREEGLTTRETQIMQVIWRFKEATVEQVQDHLPDRLVDSTIRTMLQIMEQKGAPSLATRCFPNLLSETD